MIIPISSNSSLGFRQRIINIGPSLLGADFQMPRLKDQYLSSGTAQRSDKRPTGSFGPTYSQGFSSDEDAATLPVAVAIISADCCGNLFFGFTKFFLLDGSISQSTWQSLLKTSFDRLFQC